MSQILIEYTGTRKGAKRRKQMFKLMFRPMVVVALVLTLSLIGVNRSDAANITSLSVYAGDDWGGGTTTSASLTTDEAVDYIDWYINDNYEKTSMHSAGTTSVYVYLTTLTGDIKGEKYDIKAIAWFSDIENNTFVSDTEIDTIYVFQPKFTSEVESTPKLFESVSGYSELTRQYFDGNNIAIDYYLSAHNSMGVDRRVYSRCRHVLTGRGAKEKEHPKNEDGQVEAKRIGPNFGSYSHSDSITHYGVNPNMQSYVSSAYVRLVVSGPNGTDHYFIENDVTFDSRDKPFDAPE